MGDVQETELPGVGTRFEFRATGGEHVGVVVHRSGTRELAVFDREDPDLCRTVLRLSPDDARTLVEILGASRVTTDLAVMHHEVEGVTIDWLSVSAGSRWAGRTLADAEVHSRTGVSVVAVLREGATIPAPSADTTLRPGDRLVAIGTPEGVVQLERELTS